MSEYKFKKKQFGTETLLSMSSLKRQSGPCKSQTRIIFKAKPLNNQIHADFLLFYPISNKQIGIACSVVVPVR